ncbi:MAG: hypothetical protein JW955_24795 [Sedimentisphaerales bacterium]|nr:hypothetical protein [Sedimentisphaerales bacterium]
MWDAETCFTALLLAAVFLLGGKLQAHRHRWRRAGISAAAGASMAYVFVQLMPELSEAGKVYVGTPVMNVLGLAEAHVYVAALAGFVFFYGLEHMVAWSRLAFRVGEDGSRRNAPVFLLHVGGFAAYAALVSYMMVRGLGERPLPVTMYAVAMALHFLSVDHSLRREHGAAYERLGKYVLAAAVIAGWVCAMVTTIHGAAIAMSLGLVSGGVIMNSTIMELPREKDGRFWAFLSGAAGYATVLLAVAAYAGMAENSGS